MSYEIDVFVSYAHIDDQSLVEGERGWISTFHRAFEIRLAQLLGKQPKIFRDPKLQGNDVFAQTLTGSLPKSALLVSILSPRYVRSEWCNRELSEFLKASEASGGVQVADKIRVFKVVKTPIPIEEHPGPLRDVLGYEFFTIEPDTGRARELSPQDPPESQRQYWARLDDLAQDVGQMLRTLESQNGADPAAAAEPPAAHGAVVYLAETTFDLKEQRESVRRELQAHGHEVLPDRPLPLVADELSRVVREQLARADLSIHLLGGTYGIVPEGGTESIVAHQHDLAAWAGEERGLRRLLWLAPGLETRDERQRAWLARLKTDPGLQAQADLVETSLEDFKTLVQGRLEPPEETPGPDAATAPESAPGGEVPRVYLICDQMDLEDVLPVEDALFEAGFEVMVPVFEGEEAQVRKDHEENLILCDAVLLFWGAGNELWLRRKLREIQKSPGFGRKRPFAAKGVYLGAPESAHKKRFRTHEALVLTESLTPFVEALR